MRTFIAIELPEEIKKRLKEIQAVLRKTGCDAKWVEPDNIHLTLKFLGEISEEQLPAVKAAVGQVAQENNSYRISVSGIGAFPRTTSPRVIWAGVNAGGNETGKIAQQLEESLFTLGFPREERPFSCHITLGRTRSSSGIHHLVKLMTDTSSPLLPESLEFQAAAITLFQSKLSPKGPTYEPLSVSRLK